VKITVIAAGFKEANKKNTVQKPQFLARTWKAGKEVPVAAAAAAGASSSSSMIQETQQTVVHQVQQNVRDVAHEVPADDLDVPTFLRRQAAQKA
jgi:hypothetical protein